MKLNELLGEDLWKQVEEKINAKNAGEADKLKHIRYADLSEGEYVSKAKYDQLEGEKNNLDVQIKTLNGTIATLKKDNGDNEELQKTIDKLNEDIKNMQQKNCDTMKMFALKEQLDKKGVQDPDYLIYRHGGLEEFNFDKGGNPIGIDDVLKPYKEDKAMAHLFKEQQKYKPNGGSGGGGEVNPFAKETFNLTKQGELLAENPEQARALAAAAGITI